MFQLDFRSPTGFDRTRNVEIGNKNIRLTHLEEAYTTEHWLVRIYKVKDLTNRQKSGTDVHKKAIRRTLSKKVGIFNRAIPFECVHGGAAREKKLDPPPHFHFFRILPPLYFGVFIILMFYMDPSAPNFNLSPDSPGLLYLNFPMPLNLALFMEITHPRVLRFFRCYWA